MNLSTLKKKFDFIPESLYQRLDERTRNKLLQYRRDRWNLEQKERKVKRLQQQIKDEKELIKERRGDLIDLHNQIQHLRKDFYFTCSVVSFKKGNKRYYNLLISRTGLPNKSVSLGSEEIIKEHLTTYYKRLGKRKIVSEIKKDWKTFVKVESNGGEIYEKILDMIMSNPEGFNYQKGGTTINRNDLWGVK